MSTGGGASNEDVVTIYDEKSLVEKTNELTSIIRANMSTQMKVMKILKLMMSLSVIINEFLNNFRASKKKTSFHETK